MVGSGESPLVEWLVEYRPVTAGGLAASSW